MEIELNASSILSGLSGLAIGAVLFRLYQQFRLGSFQQICNDLIQKAETAADAKRHAGELEIKKHQVEQQRELEATWQRERGKLQIEEQRLKQREDKLEMRMNLVEKKLSDIEKREAVLIARREKLETDRVETREMRLQLLSELEKVSGLTENEAKELILEKVFGDIKSETANMIRRSQKEAEETADEQAARIIATAINRMAVSSASLSTINTVSIPNDEMKGRIIGREGRNIRALEQATGVNFIIDETPNAVVLSAFDPVRLHIARNALTELVSDGRIHPTRIEEAVEKAKQQAGKEVRKRGEDAAYRAGIMNLHPEIIDLLGKLGFRYSYGQNILEHSLEVAHIMGAMAAELGLNCKLAKRIGLLHDIGKALSHEIEGTHAMVGHDFALRHGESREVANGIGCHHHEIDPLTIEGSLCAAADALSASRPGARIEAVEEYIKRIKKLEEIAYEFPGIEKAYALQAGREVRIFVLPDMIDDAGMVHLARDLTKRIENDLTYPGKVKVTVTREKRVVEYAL
ncbi:MAG: ribonuclease Y [Chlamydiales bacterium]|nr:ribonuclease Y [Chlamydiales bacterium]